MRCSDLTQAAGISVQVMTAGWHALSLESESCHDANYVVTGGPIGCHDDIGAPSDDTVGIMTTPGFQPW